jgi:acid phosphatase
MRTKRIAILVPAILVLLALASQYPRRGADPSIATAAGQSLRPNLPVYDRVVIVIEENKDYEDIIGNPDAQYINDILKGEGATFTRSYGLEHNSQGNYFWLFSGSNQKVGFDDAIPDSKKDAYPFTASSLGEQLLLRKPKLGFNGYAESLPTIGFTDPLDPAGCTGDACVYARKHVPWISFKEIPNGTTTATSSNLRFADFPRTDFSTLKTVSFVVPDLTNDMHNPANNIKDSIRNGDTWLKKNIDDYYQWAKRNNSLLILTFDENRVRHVKKGQNFVDTRGLTHPCVEPGNSKAPADPKYPDYALRHNDQNRIVTIFAGAHIKKGEYDERITHVNVLRTLEAMYGLPKSGSQPDYAAPCGITDDFIKSSIFVTSK